ncbi:MAG: hypothetical protein LUH14_00915 [Clostridiaceae bacterium]|nr:hypothetical protein [Clostridiaceae bacterium]
MKNKKYICIGAAAVCVVLAVVLAIVLGVEPATQKVAEAKVNLSTKKLTVEVGKTATLKLKNNKKKASWKIVSGKKYITLKSKKKTSVKIVGKKAGTAKVKAVVGKKKYTCTVTVKKAASTSNSSSKATESPDSTSSDSSSEDSSNTETDTSDMTDEQKETTETNQAVEKNSSDQTALTALIKAQRKLGAVLSDDFDDGRYYKWDTSSGRLIGLYWNEAGLSGKMTFEDLPELLYLECDSNSLTAIDVSQNVKLIELSCADNLIDTLDLTNNTALNSLNRDIQVVVTGFN